MTENHIAGLKCGRQIARDVMSGETSPDCAARMIGLAINIARGIPDADFSRGTAEGYAEVCKTTLTSEPDRMNTRREARHDRIVFDRERELP